MYTKQISFKDLDGKQKKRTLHFELDLRDMVVIDEILPGGFLSFYDEMLNKKDFRMLIFLVRLLVLTGYGEISKGKKFDKSINIKSKFRVTPAYFKIIKYLSTNGREFMKFMEDILPNSVVEEAAYFYEKAAEQQSGLDPLAFKATAGTIFDGDLSKFGLKLKK